MYTTNVHNKCTNSDGRKGGGCLHCENEAGEKGFLGVNERLVHGVGGPWILFKHCAAVPDEVVPLSPCMGFDKTIPLFIFVIFCVTRDFIPCAYMHVCPRVRCGLKLPLWSCCKADVSTISVLIYTVVYLEGWLSLAWPLTSD